MILLHVSPRKNRESILKNGLMLGQESSGYGPKPKKKAIYLFVENNISIIYEWIEFTKDFDIFEVNIPDSERNFLITDEDAHARTWERSIEKFGTVGFAKDIPPSWVKFLCNINTKK